MSTQCPNCGKRMDSSWRHCPYCAREEQAGKNKAAQLASRSGEGSMADGSERQRTRVAPQGSAPTDRSTRLYSGEDASQPSRSAADNRKIVGVLVSYTWDPCGELFKVRQGRTHIGAGDIRGEDRQVDVLCARDPLLSADHAMILVQGGQFYIQDLSSVNGTTVDGKQIRPESAEPLGSPAEIKTGETVFTFVRFDAVPSTVVPHVEEKVPTTRAKTELI